MVVVVMSRVKRPIITQKALSYVNKDCDVTMLPILRRGGVMRRGGASGEKREVRGDACVQGRGDFRRERCDAHAREFTPPPPPQQNHCPASHTSPFSAIPLSFSTWTQVQAYTGAYKNAAAQDHMLVGNESVRRKSKNSQNHVTTINVLIGYFHKLYD